MNDPFLRLEEIVRRLLFYKLPFPILPWSRLMLRCALLLSLVWTSFSVAQDAPWTRKEDVIYGRKFGTALTMDVFTPKKDQNGAAVIFCVSGGWFSAKEAINPLFVNEFVKHGYVVFAVVHGSQPR